MEADERAVRGAQIVEEYLGIPPSRRAGGADQFGEVIVPILWGEIWSRPGLSLQERSKVTISALVVLGRANELRLHLNAAKRHGVSYATLQEMIIHLALYAGVPAAVQANAILNEVFAPDLSGAAEADVRG